MNKDQEAVWREDFQSWWRERSVGMAKNSSYSLYELGYLAGRRKGQEELVELQSLYDKRADMLRDLRDENTSQFGEIESLKKELEDLKMCTAFKWSGENQKLRSLVERAERIIEDHASSQTVWIKEASEVLK